MQQLAPERAIRRRRRTVLMLTGVLGGLLLADPPSRATVPAAPATGACAAPLAELVRQQNDLTAQIDQLEVVLLGEIHTRAADHSWQLLTLEALRRRLSPGRRLSLALEMVPAARQPILDRFNTGELSAEELLTQVDWPAIWGHDPELYLPLLRWAQRHGVPLLGLNAEPELVRRGLQRPGLVASPVYRQQLEQSWRAHHAPQGDLQRFIGSQLLRDRVMAEQIVQALRRDRQRLVVGLIGLGHLQPDGGVPQQLQRLGPTRVLTLQRPEVQQACTPPLQRPRLGAYLESDATGIWVRQVAPGSAAAAADLRPGDRILELNGRAVERAGQVIRGVRLHPDGVALMLTIERRGRRLQLRLLLPPSAEAPAKARAPQAVPAAWLQARSGGPPSPR